MVMNKPLTWLPRAIRTEMATTEMKARIKAYSTRVWPFLLFIRRSASLALVITLLIIVFHLLSIKIVQIRNLIRFAPVVAFGTLSMIISRANRKLGTNQ